MSYGLNSQLSLNDRIVVLCTLPYIILNAVEGLGSRKCQCADSKVIGFSVWGLGSPWLEAPPKPYTMLSSRLDGRGSNDGPGAVMAPASAGRLPRNLNFITWNLSV